MERNEKTKAGVFLVATLIFFIGVVWLMFFSKQALSQRISIYYCLITMVLFIFRVAEQGIRHIPCFFIGVLMWGVTLLAWFITLALTPWNKWARNCILNGFDVYPHSGCLLQRSRDVMHAHFIVQKGE